LADLVVSLKIWQMLEKFVRVECLGCLCFVPKKEKASIQVMERPLAETLLELARLADAGL
jgi:hypothetical protein